jgi:RHS repeat-associated protein
MEVRYDHSGNRISKMDFLQGSQSQVEFIVDANSGRNRDYPTLNAAKDALSANLSTLNGYSKKVYIYQVYDKNQVSDKTSSPIPLVSGTSISPITLGDGNHKVDVGLISIEYNTDDYWDLVSSRFSMSYTSGTHYSGVGNEIRHTGADPTVTPKIITNLPLGLGRYSTGSSEKLFYVKDHLGNLRLSVPSDPSMGGYDVYDYFAYGQQTKLMDAHSGPDKITETFTGKELDEQINLSYFGARYYDQDLALWISPDPKRQYSFSYSYCGGRPTKCIDKDGNEGSSAPPPGGYNLFASFGELFGRSIFGAILGLPSYTKEKTIETAKNPLVIATVAGPLLAAGAEVAGPAYALAQVGVVYMTQLQMEVEALPPAARFVIGVALGYAGSKVSNGSNDIGPAQIWSFGIGETLGKWIGTAGGYGTQYFDNTQKIKKEIQGE